MPPKNTKPAKAKQKPQEDQREESLQAVVSVSHAQGNMDLLTPNKCIGTS